MELEIREIPSAEEKSRQNNHLASFKAELKRLQLEYNSTRRRVQRKTLLNNHSEEDSNYLEVGIFKNKIVKLISLKNYHPISLCVYSKNFVKLILRKNYHPISLYFL